MKSWERNRHGIITFGAHERTNKVVERYGQGFCMHAVIPKIWMEMGCATKSLGLWRVFV